MLTFIHKPKVTQPSVSANPKKSHQTFWNQNRDAHAGFYPNSRIGKQTNENLLNPKSGDSEISLLTDSSTTTGYEFSSMPVVSAGNRNIQAKLKINDPGDRSEQEADAVADSIIRLGHNAGNKTFSAGPTAIQRKCAACEKEEEKLKRKPKTNDSGSFNQKLASAALQSKLNGSLGKGSPLPGETNEFMGNAIGADFSKVKIHTGSDAVQMNQTLKARAFTYGSDIYFNKGEFNPGTREGKRLLGHELTHVVQQGEGRENLSDNTGYIQRKPTIEILDENFIGPPAQNQRRAAASCPIRCNGVIDVGTLHAMGLFYHRSRTGVRDVPAANDNGVGTALHFIENTGQKGCKCDGFKIIQIISTSHPAAGRKGSGYVDNGGINTPFYSDVYSGGEGEHTISVAGGFRDQGERVKTTHSIYDIPYRPTAGKHRTIEWQAESCVACIRNSKPDYILGGASYGFRIPYNNGSKTYDTIQGIGPHCVSVPSSNFVNTLRTDPTVKGYDFIPEIGLGDFPMPDRTIQYA